MSHRYEKYDVAVIGAGHAGCEAALACARLGLDTVLFTVSMDTIAMMPCNPNIGGTSKGHLVREIDALGGEMGVNIDKTFIQTKMLNESKGPAVHSLRAQADKQNYIKEMRKVIENTDKITCKQAEIVEVITTKNMKADEWPEYYCNDKNSGIESCLEEKDKKESDTDFLEKNILEDANASVSDKAKVIGVRTYADGIYPCKAIIMCTGVYLKARCVYGETSTYTGPNGLPAANYLSVQLQELGIEIYRFKTGTPARIDGRTIDFTKMEEQFGDKRIVPFSFTHKPEELERDQVSCWLTYTNPETHKIIRDNIDRSPLYCGDIKGTGPRYCPSIEDKVVRFADKERHQVFIEPEGLYTNEMYISGMSSSLPEDVQIRMYRSVPGLENAQIVRNAYAIEYDCINPMQLKPSLEFKEISGFFSAGQANGSSGYEEAAAQGIIAGINAAMMIKEQEPLIIQRSEGYIGVLIDDLVTKETREPYRMMTSRAEYRLLLRQDNADLRLTKYGYRVGLISKERYESLIKKEEEINNEIERCRTTSIGARKEVQEFLIRKNSTPLNSGTTLADLLKRTELTYEDLKEIDEKRSTLSEAVKEQVEITLKYEGYIIRQQQQVEHFKKMEEKRIPDNIDYNDVYSLRLEARQKLIKIKPISIGQASRISGVSPADISVLLVYLEQFRRRKG